ncbi:MAG: YhcH/YjgK/YiaL family protein [Chloroflexi bacterium]|nr:YhcH/YjgK/YiaL family protein [Chloroflexota bacterium]
MAIVGSIDHCVRLVAGDPRLRKGFQILRSALNTGSSLNQQLNAPSLGGPVRVDLEEGFGAILQRASLADATALRWEAHQRFIDIQCVVDGLEWMGLADMNSLIASEPYSAERDITFFRAPVQFTRLLLPDGQCAVLFPEDAHAPQWLVDAGRSVSLRVVIKVPV